MVEESYVPVVIEDMKSLKKGNDVEVTVIDPTWFQVYRASYSCSAAARVFKYHGFPPLQCPVSKSTICAEFVDTY